MNEKAEYCDSCGKPDKEMKEFCNTNICNECAKELEDFKKHAKKEREIYDSK